MKTFAVLTLVSFIALPNGFISAQDSDSGSKNTPRFSISSVDGDTVIPDLTDKTPGLLDRAYDAVFGSTGPAAITSTVDVFSVSEPGHASAGASDNDYTRISSAVDAATSGTQIVLHGTFNWTVGTDAYASWQKGNDGIPSTLDDWSILGTHNKSGVTITANSLGDATIQGPGDVAGVDQEGVFQFYTGGSNQNWTISNLQIYDFDMPIGFIHNGGPITAYSGTTISGNHLRVAKDILSGAACPPSGSPYVPECYQNIGIHFSYGVNQTISGNTIDIPGDGISNSANNDYSSIVGMQSNTSGGPYYEGLQITNNTVHVLTGQNNANPGVIVGIWENAHAHLSNIYVTSNTFYTESGVGNSAAANLQRGFRVTSHSSASTSVEYANNSVEGANIGFQFLNTGTTTNPVRFISNNIANNGTGMIMGRDVGTTNTQAELRLNRIVGNTIGIDNASFPGTVTTSDNWWGCNYGPGTTGSGCPTAPNGKTGTVTTSSFLNLTVSSSGGTYFGGTPTTVTANLNNNPGPIPGYIPNLTPISFGTTTPALGSVVSPGGSTTMGGQQTALFTAANTAGIATATATVDGQIVGTTINVYPIVTSIKRKNPLFQHVSTSSVVFEVIFNAPSTPAGPNTGVKNVDTTDFDVFTTGTISGAVIDSAVASAPFTNYNVTVNGFTGDGDIRLDLSDRENDIVTRGTLLPLGGPGTGNGDHTGDEVYTVDNTAPTVSSIALGGSSPTNATPNVTFNVTFSEAVTGVDAGDFALSGTSSGTISLVSGSGSSYVVTVSGVTSPSPSGTLGLNLVNNGTIFDTAAPTPHVLSGGSTGSQYVVDQSNPTGTIAQTLLPSPQADPTAASPISFTVVFTDALAISGFDASDVSVATGSGTAFNAATPIVNVSAATIAAPNTTYTVTVSGMDQAGQVTASIGAAAVVDGVGNNSADVVEGDNTVYYTTGLTTLVVDVDGFASNVNFPASCGDLTPTAYTSIQAAINAATPGTTSIKVCPGIYEEDVEVNKSLSLVGADKTTTIIRGQKTGDPGDISSSTVRLLAANIDISGFTLTREGNNTTDWNNPGLNTAGLSIQSSGVAPNAVIHDNVFDGNRTGIDINNNIDSPVTVRNNSISNNRTGMIMRNATNNLTVIENDIANNWTKGVLFISGGPTNECKNCAFINNNISGNWFGQIQDRVTTGGYKNFQGNWYGTPNPTFTNVDTGETGYATQIPAAYGGTGPTSVPPLTAQFDVGGVGAANLLYNLPLTIGTDTNVETTTARGTFGFQGAPIVVSQELQGVDAQPLSTTNWWVFNENVNGTGELENGPGAAVEPLRLGSGSARLSIDATGRESLGTYNYGGIRLDRITTLKYSSWQQSDDPLQAPGLSFDYKSELPGAAAYEGRLTFEPYRNGTVNQGQWQTWNARNGLWFASGGANRPLNGPCGQGTPCTWGQLLAAAPDLKIRHIADGGKLLFRAGGPWNTNFTGYVDNFEIGVSTGETFYDFESDGTPNPTVVSSVREDASPSSASSVDFIVTFSEPVIGVDSADFTLNTAGTIAGASVTGTAPLGGSPSSVWKVTVNTGSGSGDIRLDTISGGITDVAGNPLNTGFIAGEVYTMDRDAVTVTVDQQAGQADPTSVLPIYFTVQFSENVTGFDNPATDLVLGGTATSATITPVDGDTYTVAVTAASGFGFVTVSVPASAAIDNLSNANSASTSSDNSVNYTFGSGVLMVDTDGLATDTPGGCGSGIPNTAFTSIQAAVAAAAPGNTIKVCPGGAGNYLVDANAFTINQNGLTIVNAEPTKPIVEVKKPAGQNTITVLASGVTVSGIKFVKTDVGQVHHVFTVQGTNFTAQNNEFSATTSWIGGNLVTRAIEISSTATNLLISGNIFSGFRQPGYINGDYVTNMGTISGNTVTGSKGWQMAGAIVNFTGNVFNVTCAGCGVSDVSIYAQPIPDNASSPYKTFWSGANALTISGNNDNAYLDLQFTLAADSGRAVSFVDDGAPAANPDGRTATQYRSTIQDAVNNTLPGGTVNVAAGTYTENVTVDRSLFILGPNAANDPNTGSRVPEAIVRTAVKDIDPYDYSDNENSTIVNLASEGVTFKGFTLDGDNPSLTSGYVFNTADIDSYQAIAGPGKLNPNADISFNIVKNFGEFGIVLGGDANASGARTGTSTISRNKVDNVVGWGYGEAIRAGENAFTNISNNVVTRSFNGVTVENFNSNLGAHPSASVSNNNVTAYGYAMWFNLHYGYTGGYTLSGNTITSYAQTDVGSLAGRASVGPTAKPAKELPRILRVGTTNENDAVSGWGKFIGIKLESVQSSVPVTVSNNNIAVNRAALLGDTPPYSVIDGIRITGSTTTSADFDITGNTISNAFRGIAHTSQTVPDITCNNIAGNDVGVYVGSGLDYGNNAETASNAVINNNNILGNSSFGVQTNAGPSVNAQSNYWGSTDGPGPVGPGSGDKVSSNVDFASFLTAPTNCTPVAPPPTVTINQAVGQVDPTNITPVNFTVVFSESVTDFAGSDVVLSGTAIPTTAFVTGSGTTYNVAVSGMSAVGTVIATVPAGATTTGSSGPNVASTSTDNTVTYDNVSPAPSINVVTDPTSTSPVNFTVDFGEPVTGFTAGDVNTAGSTVTGTLSVVVTPAGPAQTYNVAVSGMTSSGNVVINFLAGAAQDAATNPSLAPTLTDNSIAFILVDTPITVSPTNVGTGPLYNWTGFDDVANAVVPPSFVEGPATPPLGTGSSSLNTTATGKYLFATNAYNGTMLSQITELKYGGYAVDASNALNLPSLQIGIDYDSTDGNTAGFQGRIVFEPADNTTAPNQPTAQSTWQTWDATNGKFWFTQAPGNVACGQATPCSMATILATYPRINIPATPFGFIGFRSTGGGVGPVENYVDKFTVGVNSANTTFNFEAVPPTISIDDVTVTEGNGGPGTTAMVFTVSRTVTSPLATTVRVSTATDTAMGGDFTAISNQLVTIAPNTLSTTVTVNVNGDTIDEPSEQFFVNLSNAVNGGILDAQGIGTITDDDATPIASIANASTVTEGDSGTQTTTFTVSITNASSQPITLNVTPGGAANSVGNVTVDTTSVTFPAETTASQTVSATVYGDNLVEGNQNYTATISIGSGLVSIGTATGTGTITDDDAYGSLQFSSPTYGVTEGTPTATMSVTRTGGIDGAVSATCSITGGTATGADYGVITSVSFGDQDGAAKNCTLPIVDDLISEVPETVNLLVSAPLGGAVIGAQNTSVLTITDNDGGGLINVSGTITKYTGGGGLQNVTVTVFDGVNTFTGLTDSSGNYTVTGITAGSSISVTPSCSISPCTGYIYDASSREYLSAFSYISGANFVGYLNDNPRDVTVVTTTQPSFGSATTVPITMVSQGTENSMTFKLTYDPTMLVFQSAACGAGAPGGCTVTPASGPAATPGSLTLVLDLDTGVTFAAGLKEAVKVTFGQGPGVTASVYNTPVTFAASPRSVGNTAGLAVPADWLSGAVLFAQGKEGDINDTVTPGYPDGFIDGFDVARIRNLVINPALLNNTVNEFQRADCNSFVNKGDGFIDGLDVAQVRRYVSIDPHQLAGGPTIPSMFGPIFEEDSKSRDGGTQSLVAHEVRIVDRQAFRTQTMTVAVQLDSNGDENTFQFSLHFDPSVLTMSNINGISKGPDASLASDDLLAIYTSAQGQDYTQGNVGVVLTRAPGTTFTAGTKQIILLTFTVNSSAPIGSITPITFRSGVGIQPRNLLGDVNTTAIPGATFTAGNITIVTAPTASNVAVAGHLTNAAGVAVRNGRVTLTDSNGVTRSAVTNAFGNFSVTDVPAGATYVISVAAKGYTFTPRTIAVEDEIAKFELVLDN